MGLKAPDQHAHFWRSHRKVADANATFMEIQNGSNPLTPSEIRQLINRRPWLWGRFEAFAEHAAENLE